MFGKAAGDILERGLEALSKDVASEQSKVRAVFRKIVSYPFKVLATFLAAPFLVFKVARLVDDPLRRAIAIFGLLLSLLLSYLAGTFIGTALGALFVLSAIGPIAAIGVFLGTATSVILSVTFSIIVLNSVSYLFLKINTQEIIDYLRGYPIS